MSDSQHSDSQSDFNHLNKLNPDDSQSNSQPIELAHLPKIATIPDNSVGSPSHTQSRTETKTNPVPIVQNPKPELPKKQLMLMKENKPRLIIDHLILKNFKSYAGTQKIGPFHKNFTSIVGPNGSGKSNLIQSMLFIFGFNASWMRLNKLHQLIHNSSEFGHASSAAVQVHFKKILDNADGTITQIPDSQFFIRRTVNTSSVSKYFINGNDSTQAEVKTKLKSQGIDLTNNRFLILQGEVEQISQMKQKSGDRDKPGFLQYLEDIIGSNQFIDKIQETVKEYNANEETKHEKGERMKIVENQLKNMNSQKEEAIKYVKRERKIYQIESILHQVLRSNSSHELKNVMAKVTQLESKRDQIIKEEKQKMIKQQQRVREIKKLKEEGEKIDKEINRDTQKMRELQNEDKNIKGQIAYNSEDQVKYEKQIAEIDAQFTKIIDESDAIRVNLPQKQKKLKDMRQNEEELKEKVSKHDRPQLREKIKHIQNEIKKVTLQKTTFTDKHKTLQQQVAKSSQSNHQIKAGEYKQELRKSLQMKTKIQIAIQKATQQQTHARQQHSQELNQRNRLKQEADMIDSMIRQKNSQKFQQGQFNNMFNHIMKAGVPGVLGRLGDLGDIPRQYDEPVTTACGRLDNIVCETVQAASKVLEILKTNRLGRATCIILEKISNYRQYMNQPFRAPQNSVRLFDLIKPVSQQVRVAFYFAISNTLYCQNPDQAKDLSMGDDSNRRRVIAPNRRGYIIYEMNGSMNAQYARKGGFQKKAQKKKTEQDDKENEMKLREVTRKLEEKNQILRGIQATLKELDDNIKAMKAQKVLYDSKARQLTDQLKDMQRMSDRNKGRKNAIQNMQKEMKALQKEIEKMSQQINHLQNQLTSVQNEQKKYQTAETTAMREQYKQLRQKCSKLEKEVEKEEVLITTVEKRVKENQKKKKETEQKVERLQQMIEKSNSDIQKIQKIGLELLTNIQTNKRNRVQCQRRQDAIRRQLDQDEQAVRQSRQKIQQAKAQVQNARRQIRKSQQDVKFANSQLERLRKLYKEMTSTYDFIEQIDEIEKMNIQNNGFNEASNSMLDITMHNMSLDMTSAEQRGLMTSTVKKRPPENQNKTFDMRKIEKSDPYKDLTEGELDEFVLYEAKLRALLGVEGTELKKMQGKNLAVISEYKSKFVDYKQKLKEFNEVKEKQNQLKKLINDLKQQRFQMFREGFSIINSKLKQVYQLLTNGGDAQMQLIDSLDPFSDGVNFSVRPPKKAWKQINKLSGGQKTLSSLSLIFALHYYKPTPLYFMDEIDAALDFKNVSIVGDYIKKRTKDAQFIIISLRNNMFDLADKLVGVYKTFDQTKVINLAAGKLLAKRHNSGQEKKDKENVEINLPQLKM